MTKEIYFVTGNKDKLREVKEILNIHGIEILQAEIDLPEFQGSYEEVSIAKAKMAYDKLKKPLFVDDTSLSFTALNGLPGVYIKDFLSALGHEGLNKILSSYDDKSATARVTLTYVDEDQVKTFVGECKGKIVMPKVKGGFKFGWDPIFEPNQFPGETFSTISAEDKNSISHRRKALDKFKEFLGN